MSTLTALKVDTQRPNQEHAERVWSLGTVLALAFVMLLLIAVAATGYFAMQSQREEDDARTQAFLRRAAEQYADVVRLALDDRLRMLTLVAARADWGTALKDSTVAAANLVALRAQWHEDATVELADARGRVVAATHGGTRGDDVSLRRWFVAGVRGATLTDVSGVEPADSSHPARPGQLPWLVDVVHPLRDADGRTIGVVAVHLDAALLAQLAGIVSKRQGSPFDYGVAVVGDEGHVRGASPGFPLGVPMRLNRGRAPGAPTAVEPTGAVPMAWANSPVRGSPAVDALGWTAVAVVPWSDVRSLAGLLRRSMVAALVLVAVLLPFVLLLAHWIARPLRDLTAALARSRSIFDYEPSHIPIAGPRESVQLGEAARQMLTEIAAQHAAAADSATGYRELFDLHPLPMWVIDDETLRFLEVNRAAVLRYGWSREEFLQMTVLDIRPEEARAALRTVLREGRDEEHRYSMWQHRLRSGELIDVEVASRRLQWAGRSARIVTARDVTQQRQAARDVLRHRRELSELTQRLLASEEAERRELAQVLHDQFAPSLYGVKLSIEAMLSRSGSAADSAALQADIARSLAPVLHALDTMLAEVRGLMFDLRPPLLADHGLLPALRHEAQRRSAVANGTRIVVSEPTAGAAATPRRLEATVEYALFMIVREALHNAVLHADARCIEILLRDDTDSVELTVRDDGRGFDSESSPPTGHLGLVGMRERASSIGAALSIRSGAGRGTEVVVQWSA